MKKFKYDGVMLFLVPTGKPPCEGCIFERKVPCPSDVCNDPDNLYHGIRCVFRTTPFIEYFDEELFEEVGDIDED